MYEEFTWIRLAGMTQALKTLNTEEASRYKGLSWFPGRGIYQTVRLVGKVQVPLRRVRNTADDKDH